MSREREVEVPRDGETINIMVVSDVRLYREGLADSLAQRHRLAVIATANNLDDTSRLDELKPDVVVLDMSARGSLDTIRRVSSSSARARIVAFAVEETERDVLLCAEAGASGYVACDGTMDDLVNTIHSVARGELLCSPRIAATVVSSVTHAGLKARQRPARVDTDGARAGDRSAHRPWLVEQRNRGAPADRGRDGQESRSQFARKASGRVAR
jgi:DNA-binding NarL/FixJ family response regulator